MKRKPEQDIHGSIKKQKEEPKIDLFEIVESNNLEDLKSFIEEGVASEELDRERNKSSFANIFSVTFSPEEKLKISRDKVVKSLNLEQKNDDGETPLMLAVQYGRIEMVEYLLDLGSKTSVADNENNTIFDKIGDRLEEEVEELEKKVIIKSIKSTLSKHQMQVSKTNAKNVYYDSTDEDEIEEVTNKYSLHNNKVDFEKLATRFDVTKDQVVKSFALHDMGKMVVYSPQIEKKYRKLKSRWLSEDREVQKNDGGEIRMAELGIKVENIEDIIALGRFLRRSQVRSYKNIKSEELGKRGYGERRNYSRYEQIDSYITISSGSKKHPTQGIVKETLVASFNGLGKRDFPSTDMVDLKGEDEKGDYKSAYRHSKNNHGKSRSKGFIDAGREASQQQDSDDLAQAMEVIESLKEQIVESYPKVDGDIFVAEQIRKVCKSEPLNEVPENVSDKIYALTYLLFKTESYRSPAAIVNHVQMLDLVINGEMSLSEAFVEQKMPMSIKEAIKAARTLDKAYNDEGGFYKFQNPYSYAPYEKLRNSKQVQEKDEANLKLLIEKEATLMDDWLKFKLGEEEFEEINEDIQSNLPEVVTQIYGALQGFGLNIHSKALSRAMDKSEVEERKDEGLSSSSSSSSSSSPPTTPERRSGRELFVATPLLSPEDQAKKSGGSSV